MTSPNPAGVYAPGDVVTVWVAFDRHVIVTGEPVLNLRTGKTEPGRATYVAGSGNQASLSSPSLGPLVFGFLNIWALLGRWLGPPAPLAQCGRETILPSGDVEQCTETAQGVDNLSTRYA